MALQLASCVLWQATDALEMMLLAVLSPEVRCYWRLQDWQVALISTVCIHVVTELTMSIE